MLAWLYVREMAAGWELAADQIVEKMGQRVKCMLAFINFISNDFVSLSPQHTTQAVVAAAHPAPRLLTLHRRGGRQLQSQQQPGLKSPPQTHAPFLQGHGLWPVSPTTALRSEEQISVWNPTDWAASAMNGSVWVTWGVLLVHTSTTLLPSTSTSEQNWFFRLWGGFGGRVGLGRGRHQVIRSSSHIHSAHQDLHFTSYSFPLTGLPVPDNYRCNRGCQLS